jgi:hypothetical protein
VSACVPCKILADAGVHTHMCLQMHTYYCWFTFTCSHKLDVKYICACDWQMHANLCVHLRIENLEIYTLPEIRARYKVLGRWIPPAAAQSLPTKTYECSL